MESSESTTQNWIVNFVKVVGEVNHWKVISKYVDFLHEKDGKPICKLSWRDAIRKKFLRLSMEEAVNRFKKEPA